jgi:hypothetical protein
MGLLLQELILTPGSCGWSFKHRRKDRRFLTGTGRMRRRCLFLALRKKRSLGQGNFRHELGSFHKNSGLRKKVDRGLRIPERRQKVLSGVALTEDL